jgi:hypothetical protein
MSRFATLILLAMVQQGWSMGRLSPSAEGVLLTFHRADGSSEVIATLPEPLGPEAMRAVELLADLDPFTTGRAKHGGLELILRDPPPGKRFRYAIISEPHGSDRRIIFRFIKMIAAGDIELVR